MTLTSIKGLFIAISTTLLLTACSKEPHAGPDPITGIKVLSLPQNTPDTTWRITEFWFTVNGAQRPVALYTYDSTGHLSQLTMNSDYRDNWHYWFFTVKYVGNKRYLIQGSTDTTLKVTVDSLGRATDYFCKIFGNGQPVAQQGQIAYHEPSHTLSRISRTMNGVVDTPIIYWNGPDYEPFVKTWRSATLGSFSLNYGSSPDSIATDYALYDEVDQPDEFPIRILRLSGLLPYRFKRKVTSLVTISGGTVTDNRVLTDHVIDSAKKLLYYKSGDIQYTLNWAPVP